MAGRRGRALPPVVLLCALAPAPGVAAHGADGGADGAGGGAGSGGLRAVPTPRSGPARTSPVVVETRMLGRSVRGRPILAHRLGDAGAGPVPDRVPTVVLLASMHGDEDDVRHVPLGFLRAPEVVGLDLWVVPDYNPDGLARGTRTNARGVDLNRNFPHRWADLDGRYESGRRPASEPETRAMMAFLRQVRPDRVISLHQPLNGVDTDTKDRRFARGLARGLGLPRRTFDCGGSCHGTLTMWFNRHFDGSAVTVEYGVAPSRRRLARDVPARLLAVLGARFARDAAEPWRPPRP